MRITINGIARDTENLNLKGDVTVFHWFRVTLAVQTAKDSKDGVGDCLLVIGFVFSRTQNAAVPDFIHTYSSKINAPLPKSCLQKLIKLILKMGAAP